MYEVDELPSKADMKKVTIEKPTPNWVVAIIVLAILFIAAMIYSSTYNSWMLQSTNQKKTGSYSPMSF